jgi:hypothetical protein
VRFFSALVLSELMRSDAQAAFMQVTVTARLRVILGVFSRLV